MPSPSSKSQRARNDNTVYDPRVTSAEALPIRGKIIRVRVGASQSDFGVHQDLICNSSEFFRRMMASELVEPKIGIVHLPEDDPFTFDLYVQWLYTQKILSRPTSVLEETSPEWTDLVKAYILGDRFLDARFKDTIVDAIIAQSNTPVGKFQYYPIRQITTLIYQNTNEGSPLRRLIVDQHVHFAKDEWYRDASLKEMDPEFLFDLLKAYTKMRPLPPGPAPDTGSETCQKYHEHEKHGLKCHRSNQPANVNTLSADQFSRV